MTALKVIILVALVCICGWTLYKLIMQIKEYKQKKASAQNNQESSKQNENSLKEDKN